MIDAIVHIDCLRFSGHTSEAHLDLLRLADDCVVLSPIRLSVASSAVGYRESVPPYLSILADAYEVLVILKQRASKDFLELAPGLAPGFRHQIFPSAF